MKQIESRFDSHATTRFVIDDDPGLAWLSSCDTSGYQRVFVYIDANVNTLWGGLIADRLRAHNKPVLSMAVEAVEESKSLAFYGRAIEFLEANRANRHDLVVAIGGGIIIDLAGFVCSTYMRGLPLWVVGTTLIGQVDAPTAGKTCLNTGASKNLLGTFYYPEMVYNNIHFLRTNSGRVLRQGLSEVHKYGLLASADLIDKLEEYRNSSDVATLTDIIARTIDARVSIRHVHPLASNLGHTFGHAIETLSDYAILHGDAISAGTVMALEFAAEQGLIERGLARDIEDRMIRLGLNVYVDRELNADKLVNTMMRDKKASSRDLGLVLITGVAKPFAKNGAPFFRADPSTVRAFLERFLGEWTFRISNCADKLQADEIDYVSR